MSDLYDYADDYRGEDDSDREHDDDWDDDDDWREPDPEDAEIARAYEEEAGHRETVHGGGECTCRPSLARRLELLADHAGGRLRAVRNWLTTVSRQPVTVRLARLEVTVRLARECTACGGKGWRYSLVPGRPDDRPAGYNGAALCGCGSATGKLAGDRRMMRRAMTEPPF